MGDVWLGIDVDAWADCVLHGKPNPSGYPTTVQLSGLRGTHLSLALKPLEDAMTRALKGEPWWVRAARWVAAKLRRVGRRNA